RVFTGRAAAEVVSGHEDPCASGFRGVEDEVGPGIALVVVAPVLEQVRSQTGPGGGLQEARGDDLIGVDIVDRQHHGAASDRPNGIHWVYLSSSRGSVTLPVTAAAAAVRGLARSVRPPAP